MAGESLAVTGASGSGKSTLLGILAGLDVPSTGEVILNGNNLSQLDEEGRAKVRARNVGFIFQSFQLLPGLSAHENVMLPLEIVEPYRSNLRKNRVQYTADAEALLAKVGLAGCGNKFPWELSGGMQQRASICRALIHQPRLLMLDEPFGALDAFTREELWCMLRDLWQQQPFTVVLVTHDLREAVFLADTVFVMSKRPGRILARKEIELPRPRPLDVTYTDAFAGYVHELREHIGRIRES